MIISDRYPHLTISLGLFVLPWLLIAPSTVEAQTVTITTTLDGTEKTTDELTLNISECREAIGSTVNFTITLDDSTSDIVKFDDYVYKIESHGGDCSTSDISSDNDVEPCERISEDNANVSEEAAFNTLFFSDLTDISPDSCFDADERKAAFSVVFTTTGDDSTTTQHETFTLNIEATRPNPPTITSVVAGENAINIEYSEPEDAPTSDDDGEVYDYKVYFTEVEVDESGNVTASKLAKEGVPELTSVDSKAAGSGTSYNLDSGISVGKTYQIAVVSVDGFKNESLFSNIEMITTAPTNDFYENYRNSGGVEMGGFCTVNGFNHHRAPLGALGLALFGLVVVGLRKRRQHASRAAAILLLSGIVLTPQLASAQEFDIELDDAPSGSLEIRFGNYLPQVDSAFDGSGPYEQIFGNESMLLAELEFGRYLGDFAGAWRADFTFGFMQAVGKAVDNDGAASVDTTVFNIIPLRLGGSYHLDLLAKHYNIPFVPVLKLGADYYIWWITDGDGETAESDAGGRGSGGTLGWHAAFALHLQLDFFDARSAANLNFDFGIQNTYLFGEYLVAEVDDFGDSSSIVLSDSTLMFGLAFDY